MLPKQCTLKLGQKFNYLTIIGYAGRDLGYICKCECGNETKAKIWNLKTGTHKSCGCMSEKFRAKRVAKNNFGGLKSNLYSEYRGAAKRRNYEFELSKEQFIKLITSNCHYCGQVPTNFSKSYGNGISETDYTQFKYNGVDRVDNNKGYTSDNSVSCCKICNNSKASLTLKDWKTWIKRIAKFI